MVVFMRRENDCGIAVVSTITEEPYETVIGAWPGGFYDPFRAVTPSALAEG